MSRTRGCYLYGIVRSDATLDLSGWDGVAKARSVELVQHGDVAALVSRVDPEGFTPKKADLLAHANVLELAARDTDVLPWRFGSIFPSDDELVGGLLTANERNLIRLLDDLQGVVELQIKATYEEESIMREIATEDPTVRRARSRSGGSYQERIQLGTAVAEALDRRRKADTRKIERHIHRVCESCAVGPLTTETMIVNLACLVRRDSVERFEHEVAMMEQGAEGRIHFRLLGPLPPYSFVDPSALAVA